MPRIEDDRPESLPAEPLPTEPLPTEPLATEPPAPKAPASTALRFAGVWCVFVLLRFVFGNEIQQQALGLLALATDAVLLCAGVVAVWKLVSAFCRTRRAMPVLGLVVVLSLGWGAYGTRMLWDAGTHLRFLWLRSIYAEIVAKLGDSSFPGAGIYQGVAYQTDEGVELRVAFVWRGITDNWVGVVYDPTGLVMRANEFLNDWSNWKDPDLAEVKGLFGGDMIGARHLEGHWYLCGFT